MLRSTVSSELFLTECMPPLMGQEGFWPPRRSHTLDFKMKARHFKMKGFRNGKRSNSQIFIPKQRGTQ